MNLNDAPHPANRSRDPRPGPTSEINFPISKWLVTAVLVLSSQVASADVTNGLVAYYPFEGNAKDATGNGHDGVPSGNVGYAAGVFGQAAVFHGNDYITAIDNSVGNLGASGSLAYWFCPAASSLDGWQHRPWEKDYGTWWMFILEGNRLFMTLKGAPSYVDHGMDFSNSITAGQWYSVIAVKSGQNVDTYLNSVHVDSEPTGADGMTTSAYMTFGRSQYWNSQYFSGMIDEARVYDRALTQGEIAELSVPEPSVLSLIFLGGLTMLRWGRRPQSGSSPDFVPVRK